MGLSPRGTLPSMRPAFAPGRNFVGRPQALVGPNLAHDDVYRRHDRSCRSARHCRSTAAAAMINYEANGPLAAFAPQNDAAAGSTQNPVAGSDTEEAPIFQGQSPPHYAHEHALAKAAITLLAVRPSHNPSPGF